MQDKTEKWRFRSYEEHVHGSEIPLAGERQMPITCCIKFVAATDVVTQSRSCKAGKVGPSHIKSESGHSAKPVPVKPVLSGPTACLPQLRRQSCPPQPEARGGPVNGELHASCMHTVEPVEPRTACKWTCCPLG